jgi:hypothetical protein
VKKKDAWWDLSLKPTGSRLTIGSDILVGRACGWIPQVVGFKCQPLSFSDQSKPWFLKKLPLYQLILFASLIHKTCKPPQFLKFLLPNALLHHIFPPTLELNCPNVGVKLDTPQLLSLSASAGFGFIRAP